MKISTLYTIILFLLLLNSCMKDPDPLDNIPLRPEAKYDESSLTSSSVTFIGSYIDEGYINKVVEWGFEIVENSFAQGNPLVIKNPEIKEGRFGRREFSYSFTAKTDAIYAFRSYISNGIEILYSKESIVRIPTASKAKLSDVTITGNVISLPSLMKADKE